MEVLIREVVICIFPTQGTQLYLMPHPLKEKAKGKPVVKLPLILFSDDTSGNKSKKWHKFDSWSVIDACWVTPPT